MANRGFATHENTAFGGRLIDLTLKKVKYPLFIYLAVAGDVYDNIFFPPRLAALFEILLQLA